MVSIGDIYQVSQLIEEPKTSSVNVSKYYKNLRNSQVKMRFALSQGISLKISEWFICFLLKYDDKEGSAKVKIIKAKTEGKIG